MDAAKLREAIEAAQNRAAYDTIAMVGYASGPTADQLHLLAEAASAHLSTLPQTKEVEVWRVEFWDVGPCINQRTSYAGALDRQSELVAGGHARCIRVTGPHKQTVPA